MDLTQAEKWVVLVASYHRWLTKPELRERIIASQLRCPSGSSVDRAVDNLWSVDVLTRRDRQLTATELRERNGEPQYEYKLTGSGLQVKNSIGIQPKIRRIINFRPRLANS